MGKKRYHFVIPEIKTELIGTQGEKAVFMPYTLEERLSTEGILEELKRQPHMAKLASYIDPEKKIYLLEGSSLEQLQLAAAYIATYHRLWDVCVGDCETKTDAESDDWQDGDINFREFDFNESIPYLTISDLMEVYAPHDGSRFGGWMYREEKKVNRPWWTMDPNAPIIVTASGNLSLLPGAFRAMEDRQRIILLYHRDRMEDDFDSFGSGFMFDGEMNMESLSFELETEMLLLEKPAPNGDYKKEILMQLAKDKGEGLASSANKGKILSLITESRGNVDNLTLSKAVSNAYLRRKREGKLTEKDFAYLSMFRTKKQEEMQDEREMELIGQAEVRTQLERIVKSMVFQKKREQLGLPHDNIHYTFAFMGAPGTGKTTWAKRLANEMKKHGLLSNTESICINAAELKAKYVGHTTGKVKALFEQYSVIILDEAYSLMEGKDGDSFGAEALAQLCVELENYGNQRLVIFAGYGGSANPEDNRMLRFLQSNPGINSRVSFKVHFDNFKEAELVQVFHTMMQHGGYTIRHDADKKMEEFFRYRMQERAFGNCREVRNLMDRVKIHMAERMMEKENYSKEEAVLVLRQDVEMAMEEIRKEYDGLRQEEGNRIGFEM
ncbi:MAG: AAA family ATPase [Bacillota bacterium]|nr:AAA family ATPase [Bacillota bacterium]